MICDIHCVYTKQINAWLKCLTQPVMCLMLQTYNHKNHEKYWITPYMCESKNKIAAIQLKICENWPPPNISHLLMVNFLENVIQTQRFLMLQVMFYNKLLVLIWLSWTLLYNFFLTTISFYWDLSLGWFLAYVPSD